MAHHYAYDAVVVGSGPNGLAAAITLAQAGHSVLVLEAEQTVGGGTRTAELTLPGFRHDICSTVHPLAAASPFFSRLPLAEYGLEWVFPPAALAHPLGNGSAAVLERSVAAASATMGRDAAAYRRLISPLVTNWAKVAPEILGPLRLPRHPLALAGLGLFAVWPATVLARLAFRAEPARAVFGGLAGHSMVALDQPVTAGFGLVLAASAHAVGWPVARGGSQAIATALVRYFHLLGGAVATGVRVRSVDELPPARAVLFDVTPRQLLSIAGDRLPAGYRRALGRYRYGPGVFKVDWALNGPIPWKAAGCLRAATIHLGGTLVQIADAERAVWQGKHPEKPYIILVQPTLFDASRAPEGKHTAWAYCHVPNGSTFDMTERIEAQIERYAPGFRDCILARHVMPPAAMEQHNANYIGGDINGGVQDMWQFYTRPTLRRVPYSTPAKELYLCSSSTPPGGGVHGMCGYFAARAALDSALMEE
jgi:phytoene dehydrogenase-like protein